MKKIPTGYIWVETKKNTNIFFGNNSEGHYEEVKILGSEYVSSRNFLKEYLVKRKNGEILTVFNIYT